MCLLLLQGHATALKIFDDGAWITCDGSMVRVPDGDLVQLMAGCLVYELVIGNWCARLSTERDISSHVSILDLAGEYVVDSSVGTGAASSSSVPPPQHEGPLDASSPNLVPVNNETSTLNETRDGERGGMKRHAPCGAVSAQATRRPRVTGRPWTGIAYESPRTALPYTDPIVGLRTESRPPPTAIQAEVVGAFALACKSLGLRLLATGLGRQSADVVPQLGPDTCLFDAFQCLRPWASIAREPIPFQGPHSARQFNTWSRQQSSPFALEAVEVSVRLLGERLSDFIVWENVGRLDSPAPTDRFFQWPMRYHLHV